MELMARVRSGKIGGSPNAEARAGVVAIDERDDLTRQESGEKNRWIYKGKHSALYIHEKTITWQRQWDSHNSRTNNRNAHREQNIPRPNQEVWLETGQACGWVDNANRWSQSLNSWNSGRDVPGTYEPDPCQPI
jgi:hypothetical protein